ncbi:2974_t:CDS:2, partial [Gigaspora margarita]
VEINNDHLKQKEIITGVEFKVLEYYKRYCFDSSISNVAGITLGPPSFKYANES